MKTVQATDTATIKAYGGPARVLWITISNNGTVGVAGLIELREAVTPAGDTGTVRWSTRFLSSDEQSVHYDFIGEEGDVGIPFADGVRLVVTSATNLIITVGLAG